MKYKHITVKPSDGGQLMMDSSAENAGIANYTEKTNFRRYLDKEIRREGFDYFAPKPSNHGVDPFPSQAQDPITFIYTATRPNGDKALIVGVEENDGVHLYKYKGSLNNNYVESGYWPSDYTDTSTAGWLKITGDTSPLPDKSKRLQAVTVNGTTVFNNGVDLPVAYRLEWAEVKPVYQIREAGIVSVESISDYSGMLCVGNVTQTTSGQVDLFDTDAYGTIMDGTSVFHSRLANSEISSPLNWAAVNSGWIDEYSIRLDLKGHPLSFSIGDEITITGAGALGGNHTAKVHKVHTGGEVTPTLGTGGAYIVPAHGRRYWVVSATGGSCTYKDKKYYDGSYILTDYSQERIYLNVGTPVEIHDSSYLILSDPADTSVSGTDVALSSSGVSFAGFTDLADDGDSIVNMEPLQNSLIVYKDKEIVQVEFTANESAPFRTRLIKTEENNLYFKNSLLTLDGETHFFAGRDAFYLFGLGDSAPREIQLGRLVREKFFQNAFISNTKNVFSSQNRLTDEVWINFLENGSPVSLCWNYVDQSFSYTDMGNTASAMITRPRSASEEAMYLMGFSNGVLCFYGLSDKNQWNWGNTRKIFYRRNEFDLDDPAAAEKLGYTSILKSGRGDFGDSYNEKTLRGYVLIAASSQPADHDVKVKLTAFGNPFDTTGIELMDGGEYTLSNLQAQNLIPLFGKAHLLQDTITIDGKDNPVEITARIFDVSGVKTRSETRQPS
jgi:hypothetical protein